MSSIPAEFVLDDTSEQSVDMSTTQYVMQQQVVIPTVPASLGGVSYSTMMVSGGAGAVNPTQFIMDNTTGVAPVGSMSSSGMIFPDSIYVSADVLHSYGLERVEQCEGLLRWMNYGYKDGSSTLRETLVTFTSCLTLAVERTCAVVQDKVEEIQQVMKLEHAQKLLEMETAMLSKDDEISQLRREKDEETSKASRLSDQLDLCGTAEANLRNEMDGLNATIRELEQSGCRQTAAINALKDELAAAKREGELISAANEELKATVETDKQKITEKEDELLKLKLDAATLESTFAQAKLALDAAIKQQEERKKQDVFIEHATKFLNGMRVLVTAGGPLFDPVRNDRVEYPILCCSGDIIPAKALIEVWSMSDGFYDGTIGRMFSCVQTHRMQTSIAPRAHVELIQTLAVAVGLPQTNLPLVIEYFVSEEWHACSMYDTLEVLARICRIYRRGVVEADDTCMINGQYTFSFIMIDDGSTAGSMVKKLMISVQHSGCSYEGRLRVIDESWTPFPGMMFRD
jgi:ribosomal protein L19E